MTIARRAFLRQFATASGSAILTPSLAGLSAWSLSPRDGRSAPDLLITPYGRLAPSVDCPELEIPERFRCVRLSRGGVPSAVRDGLTVPNAFDGMAAFPLPNGNVRLIRNHEMIDNAESARPIGEPAYDPKGSGGTTSLEVRISGSGAGLGVELIDEFVSLAGTRVNCAGGSTPWGSWLSCEEITSGPEDGYDKPHGYIFEVPVDATGPVDPVPLREMGRFIHEAVAVDPATGIVYETEDTWYDPGGRPGAGLYRFIPNRPGVLAAGGRLQMMAVTGKPTYLTARGQSTGQVHPVHWVDIDDPDPPNAGENHLAVFWQGMAKGGARFARLEGAFHGDDGIYVVSTNGGDATAGQVFHYRPLTDETGELRMVFESPSKEVLEAPDNICLSPGGGLIMCEDGCGRAVRAGVGPRRPHREPCEGSARRGWGPAGRVRRLLLQPGRKGAVLQRPGRPADR